MITFSDNDLILVTGASSGIGRAIALLLNSLGSRVVAVARNEERLKDLVAEAKYSDKMFYALRDLSADFESVPEFIKNLVAKYGKFSGLVNCAGICEIMPLNGETISNIMRTIEVNFLSGVSLLKVLSGKRYRQDKLASVFFSSIASIEGNSGMLAYSASKGAINSAVKSLAKELGQYDIRVNAILPGNISTMQGYETNNVFNYEHKPVLNSDNRTQYIANTTAFLLSEASYWIQGQGIVVDGGETL